MKFQFIKKIIPALLFVTVTAFAGESVLNKFYLRADGGYGFPQSTKNSNLNYSFKNTHVYGVGAGFRFNDMFRADINYQHMELKSDKNSLAFSKSSTDAIFLNGYFNLTDFEQMTPYLTGGVGYAMNNSKNVRRTQGIVVITAEGDKTKSFAWNVGAGTTLQVHKNTYLDFGYRFVNIGDVKMKNVQEDGEQIPPINLKKNKVHQVTVGLVFNL